MAALTTVAELRARFAALADYPDELLELALDDAEGELLASLDRKVIKRAAVVSEFEGTGTGEVLLPEWPVASIELVQLDGATLDASSYRVRAEEGVLVRRGGWYWPECAVIRAEYTAGYDPVPRPLIRALHILAWIFAERQLAEAEARQGDEKKVQLGAASVEYQARPADGTAADMLPWEVEGMVRRYRRER